MLFFGRVPEPYIKSIEGYPLIFFNDHTQEPKLEYAVAVKEGEETYFKYDLNLNLESNNSLDKRYKALKDAVRKLFWKEAKVEIRINGEEVYKSE